ncbi:MAG: ComF family protein [Chloroflexi bacterium]|nr:ComF family protein [Chloroflexota bacterium]
MAVPSLKIGYTDHLRVIAERAWWASLDLVLPPRCQNCNRAGERLCAQCRAEIEYISEPMCQKCGYPKHTPTTVQCEQCWRVAFAGNGLRALAFHAGPLRRAVHGLKYKHNPPLSEALARLISPHWPAIFPGDSILIPVPLAPDRLRQRGFNQAELLARHVGAQRGLPVWPAALRRVRATESQVGKTAQARQANMTGAFAAETKTVRGLNFVLIDDVCTTGATLGACAQALLEGGAAQVWAYTLTRARHDSAD